MTTQRTGIYVPISLVDPQRAAKCKQVLSRPPEIVTAPDSHSLNDYQNFLARYFSEGEVEPLERVRYEMTLNHVSSDIRYICVLAKVPSDTQIVSAAYASIRGGILAIRFMATLEEYRGTGLSQELNRILFEEAKAFSQTKRQRIWCCFGECVNRSESFCNRLFEPPLRRVYAKTDDGYEEIHYELPHLGGWNSDGSPTGQVETVLEHLQVTDDSGGADISVQSLSTIIKSVWEDWYIQPESCFADEKAFKSHHRTIMQGTLGSRILEPLKEHDKVFLLTRVEREQLKSKGVLFRELSITTEN